MTFKPYIEAVFATTDEHNESDLRKAKRKSRMTLLDDDIGYENYHEQMGDLGMYTSWHYAKSKGQINGYVITGYELHLYNGYDAEDEHKIIALPCEGVNP